MKTARCRHSTALLALFALLAACGEPPPAEAPRPRQTSSPPAPAPAVPVGSVCRVPGTPPTGDLRWLLGHGSLAAEGSNGAIHSLVWSGDGARLAASSLRAVIVWDVTRGAPRTMSFEPPLAADEGMGDVRFGEGGSLVVATGKRIAVFDAATGALIRSLTLGAGKHFRPQSALSADGRTLATIEGDAPALVHLRDTATLAEHASFEVPCPKCVLSATFARGYPPADLALDLGNRVELRDWTTGALRTNMPVTTRHIASPDGKTLAATTDDALLLLDAQTGKTRTTVRFPWASGHMFMGFTPPPLSVDAADVAWSPDGALLAVAAVPANADFSGNVAETRVTILDARTGARKVSLPRPFRGSMQGLVFSPDGARLFTGAADTRGFRTFDAKTGEPLSTAAPLLGRVREASPAADTVAVASDGVVVIEDAKDGGILRRLGATPVYTSALALAPGGDRLAAGGARLRWITASGVTLADPAGTPELGIAQLAWSPDGGALAASVGDMGAASGVVLWEATGRRLGSLPFAAHPETMSWGSGGGTLALFFAHDAARVIDRTGKLTCDTRDKDLRRGVASPDGARLAFHVDDEVRVWDATTCKPLDHWPTSATRLGLSNGDVVTATDRELERRAPGGAPRKLALSPECTGPLVFAPDGASYVPVGGEVLCSTETGAASARLPGLGSAEDAQWDVARGTLTAHAGDELATWDAQTGTLRALVTGAGRAALTPDRARAGVLTFSAGFDLPGALPRVRLVRTDSCVAATLYFFEQPDRTGWLAVTDDGHIDGDDVGLSLVAIASDGSLALAGDTRFDARRVPGLLANLLGAKK